MPPGVDHDVNAAATVDRDVNAVATVDRDVNAAAIAGERRTPNEGAVPVAPRERARVGNRRRAGPVARSGFPRIRRGGWVQSAG